MKSKGWYLDRDQKKVGRKKRKSKKERIYDKKDKIGGGSVYIRERMENVLDRVKEEAKGRKKREKGIVGKDFNARTGEKGG